MNLLCETLYTECLQKEVEEEEEEKVRKKKRDTKKKHFHRNCL